MGYEVAQDLYEGPLSLLVELVHVNLMDVFLVKLHDLTRDYLAHVGYGSGTLDAWAEPLPLFGRLLMMKARGLLPRPPALEDEEDAPLGLEELQRRLQEYEQFKTAAQWLAQLHALQQNRMTRRAGAGEGVPDAPAADGPCEVSVTDLMGAFAKVLRQAPAPAYEVKAEAWTVERAVTELRMALMVKRQMRFLELFTPQQTRVELVVVFLALLELIRQHQALAVQERPFEDILITWASESDERRW